MSRIKRTEQILLEKITPNYLLVQDESHMHNVPVGSESHFKITAVSTQFAKLNLVARHQMIYALLQPELEQGLHALSLHLYTPEEWFSKNGIIPNSPSCRNGRNN